MSELRATRHTVNSVRDANGEVILTYKPDRPHSMIAQEMMAVFRKYWLQPQFPESTVELVETYIRLYPDVAVQDEFLKRDVLPVMPEKLKGRDLALIPTADELRKKGAITAQHAAHYLHCTRRTIRNYLLNGELTRTGEGLVLCDDKLSRRLRTKYGSAFRLK